MGVIKGLYFCKFIIHGNFSTFSFVMNSWHYFIKITFTYIYRTKNKRQPHKVNLLGIFLLLVISHWK